MCDCRCGGCCCLHLPAGGRELWSGRKIPPPLPLPELGTARSPQLRCRARAWERVRGEWRPAPLPLLIVHWGLRCSAPLFPTPTGLRPPWFESFAFACFYASRPRPGLRPRLGCRGPLLFEFRLATEGVFVDVPWGRP